MDCLMDATGSSVARRWGVAADLVFVVLAFWLGMLWRKFWHSNSERSENSANPRADGHSQTA